MFFYKTITAIERPDTSMTNWKIEPSFKYDALCFLNILTGDTFYLEYYQNDYDQFKDKIPNNVKSSLSGLKKNLKDNNGRIISAFLCLYFSAAEDSTLDQMIKRLDNLDELKTKFLLTPYYDDESWKLFESTVPQLKVIFNYLKEIHFEEYWKINILPIVQKKIEEVESGLSNFDVIRENEYYLGFKLPSNEITVYMLYYVQPHGIRITGMRFLTDVAWPFKIVIRNSAHEMMHPPYDIAKDKELKEAIESFKNDGFFMDKVTNHNPSFGYNTIEGLFEEDCVQSLDQLINEKLGVALDAHKRWKESDGGIHVLAIALYQIMKEENYNVRNEVFRVFLMRIISSGKLKPGSIKSYYEKFYN